MPYFDIVVKEIGPVTVSSAPTTDRILIIGPAVDGPVNQIVKVNSQLEAISIFGPMTYTDIYNNPVTNTADGTYCFNELVRNFTEVLKTGANNIYLCRTGGQRAIASGSAAIGGASGIMILAENPGFVYNGLTATMVSNGTTGVLTITQPSNRGGNVTYSYNNTITINQLINQVNSDNRVVMMRLYPSTATNLYAAATTVTGSATLAGGTNGTEAPGDDNYRGKFAMYTALTTPEIGTFDTTEDFQTDLVLLAGMYLDDQVVTGSAATTTSIISSFAQYCGYTGRETLTHGIIGMRSLGFDRSDPDRVTSHILSYWEDTNPGFVDSSRFWIKAGYFRQQGVLVQDAQTGTQNDFGASVSVVAGPDVRLNTTPIGAYQTNPAPLYAGLISTLASERATTKQLIPGSLGSAFSIREKQIKRLINGVGFNDNSGTGGQGAFVILRDNIDDASTEVAYDVTFANSRTPAFADLQPQRVVGEAIRNIRAVLLPFLGDGFNANVHMAMEQQVRSVLDGMSASGKLNSGGEGVGYQFTVNGSNPLLMANNEVEVELTLWPAQQIKRIRITTTVRRS